MKCPQLSKPEATAARNQNSIGDRMEKKALGETRLRGGGGGGAVLLWPDEPAVQFQLLQSQIGRAQLVPVVQWYTHTHTHTHTNTHTPFISAYCSCFFVCLFCFVLFVCCCFLCWFYIHLSKLKLFYIFK